jgi:LuxR family maltose regulon positive regulatory protein
MPLSTTKLKRPPLASDYVARSKLLAHLEWWRERPLTLVSTPAGYGKSTLLSAWLQETEAASGWLSLETRDDSLHALASGMVQAIEGATQHSLPRTSSWLQQTDLADPESLARQLVEEIEEADTSLILVLDDYHFIRDREANEFVTALIESKSGTLRLAIATRMDPPLPLARFRARGQITEIRQDDLSFTDDEAGEFLTKALEREVESEVARKLNEKTEGWPAGLRLGALTLQRAEDPEAFLDQLPTGGRFVTDYLVTEVLSQQTPVVQEYLLRTSVVDRFCPELCDALFEVDLGHSVEAGVVDGVAFIKLVARANVFLIPLDDAGQWFRYHHLFGDLLRHQLKGRNTAGQIRKLHERGSAWLEGQGFLEDAIEQAFHADLELTTELLSGHRHDIMNAEKWYELGQWLKRIPEKYIDGSPELLLLLAWTMEHFQHLEEMIDLTHRAGALLQGADDVDSRSLMGEVESLLSFESYFIALDGRGAIEHLETSLNLLDPEADCARGFTVVMLALSYQMVGDMEGARRVVREHMRPGTGPPGTFDGRLVTALLVVDWIAGDLHRLRVDAGEGCRIGREGQLSETLGLAMYFRTVAAYERNDLAAAQEYLVSELSRLPKGDPWILNYTGFLLAMVREGQGRSHEARQIAESLSAQALQLRLPNQESLAHSFEAYIALRQGRLAEAVRWADKNDPGPVLPPYLWYNPHLTYAKVRLAQGREAWDALETFLARLREVYDSIHCTRALAEVLALEALLQEARGNGTPALQNLSEALRLAEPGGCVRLFVDLGPDMRDLLRKLGPGSSSLGFAGRILAAFAESSLGISGEIPSSPSVADSDPRRLLATELTHREMEVLTLLAERLSNKEIAARLDIGPATVKTHAATLYQKLNVSGRRQVVAKAEALGILPQSPR